jgi:hypothetical protein
MGGLVADSIEFLMWLKNLIMLTDNEPLTEYINLKDMQNICFYEM